MRRRSVLAASAAMGVGIFAGCLGTTSDDSSDNPDAVATLEAYVEASAAGDDERMAALRLPALEIEPQASPVDEVVIHETEELSYEAAADAGYVDEDGRSELEAMVDDVGADDYTFVDFDVEYVDGEESTREDGVMNMLADDGEWYVGFPIAS